MADVRSDAPTRPVQCAVQRVFEVVGAIMARDDRRRASWQRRLRSADGFDRCRADPERVHHRRRVPSPLHRADPGLHRTQRKRPAPRRAEAARSPDARDPLGRGCSRAAALTAATASPPASSPPPAAPLADAEGAAFRRPHRRDGPRRAREAELPAAEPRGARAAPLVACGGDDPPPMGRAPPSRDRAFPPRPRVQARSPRAGAHHRRPRHPPSGRTTGAQPRVPALDPASAFAPASPPLPSPRRHPPAVRPRRPGRAAATRRPRRSGEGRRDTARQKRRRSPPEDLLGHVREEQCLPGRRCGRRPRRVDRRHGQDGRDPDEPPPAPPRTLDARRPSFSVGRRPLPRRLP